MILMILNLELCMFLRIIFQLMRSSFRGMETWHSSSTILWNTHNLEICSGCLWNSFVYLGKEPNRNGDDPDLVWRIGKSGAVISGLMETLLNKGYRLYVDNWYTSQALFSYPHENNTAACETAQKNPIKFPRGFTEHRFQKTGEPFTEQTWSTLADRIRKATKSGSWKLYMITTALWEVSTEIITNNYNSVQKSMKWTKSHSTSLNKLS